MPSAAPITLLGAAHDACDGGNDRRAVAMLGAAPRALLGAALVAVAATTDARLRCCARRRAHIDARRGALVLAAAATAVAWVRCWERCRARCSVALCACGVGDKRRAGMLLGNAPSALLGAVLSGCDGGSDRRAAIMLGAG